MIKLQPTLVPRCFLQFRGQWVAFAPQVLEPCWSWGCVSVVSGLHSEYKNLAMGGILIGAEK